MVNLFDILPLDVKRIIMEKFDFKNFMIYSELFDMNIDDYYIKLFIKRYNYYDYLNMNIYLINENKSSLYRKKFAEAISNKIFDCDKHYIFNKTINKIKRDDMVKYLSCNIVINVDNIYKLKKFKNMVDDGLMNIDWLVFHENFKNQLPINSIPKTVFYLFFNNSYDQNIDNLSFESADFKSSNITKIYFGDNFNTTVDKLPPNITDITFGKNFNKYINNLPNSLINLRLGDNFNRNIDNISQKNGLKNLQKLYFGEKFKMSVDNLPQSLIKIKFGGEFNQKIDKLPPNIKIIKFDSLFNYSIFNHKVDNLPLSVEYIKFGHNFNNEVNNLPKNITKIVFGKNFNQKLDNLPISVKHITLPHLYNQSIDHLYPFITHLTINVSSVKRPNIKIPLKNIPKNIIINIIQKPLY